MFHVQIAVMDFD